MSVDAINSFLILVGGLFAWNNVRILHRDKEIHGVSLLSSAFFSLCTVWNCYMYDSLSQVESFRACCVLAAANVVWICYATLLRVKSKLIVGW